jgi:Cu/Ag efflux pump CusA
MTFAMIGATLLAVTLVPVLCTFFVRGPFRSEADNWAMSRLIKLYEPALAWALRHRPTVVGALVLAFGLPRPVARLVEAQTAIVMVVYLEEAPQQRQIQCGIAFNQQDLVAAVMAGAKLRLRPKVMTVTTTVAALLPIMWNTSTGTELMRPLATPVIGGMISSFLHIMFVTPVLFAWLRERESVLAPVPPPVPALGPFETIAPQAVE